jgi:hypothetical protein
MTRFILSFIVAGSVTCLSAGPAEALRRDEARLFAACALKKFGPEGRALLAAPIDSPEEAELAQRIGEGTGKCLEHTQLLGLNTDLLRAGIAEELMLGAGSAADGIAALPAIAVPAVRQTSGRAQIASIATCLVGANPAAGLAVIRTVRGSEAEKSAMNKFGAAATTCGLQGAGFNFATEDTRNHVANALYQRVAGNKVS